MVNEVTTVAGMAALAPYMTALGAIGSSPADTEQLANAFALASQFVDPATGSTPGSGAPFDTTVHSYIINTVGAARGLEQQVPCCSWITRVRGREEPVAS
jgi:hypothetical protein